MKRGRFPQRIKRGSCVVTIYRTPSKGYESFTVAHYDAKGKFCRRPFADYAEARSVAEDTAENFAGGHSDTHVLTGQELLIYRRATNALKKAGVSLGVAAIQFAKLSKRAGIRWKKNGLRHSFVSYRTAMSNNIPSREDAERLNTTARRSPIPVFLLSTSFGVIGGSLRPCQIRETPQHVAGEIRQRKFA
jgi:hypothetical protein